MTTLEKEVAAWMPCGERWRAAASSSKPLGWPQSLQTVRLASSARVTAT